MSLSLTDAAELAKDRLLPAWKHESERLKRIDDWYRWDQENPELPRAATRELKRLVQLAKTPWLSLVVTTVAQTLYVDGYRSPEDPDNAGPWRTWQGNDMDSRQVAVHRAALAYGYSFVQLMPGVAPDGSPMAVLRGKSPRAMQAFYVDPAGDDWPQFALEVERASKDEFLVRVLDEERVFYLSANADLSKVEPIEYREHRAGVCPVVRYANMLDLDGRADGEVEPFIGVAARINKTALDRLLVQHFGSWKVRTIAGLSEPETDEAQNIAKLKLRQDDLLVAEDPDTKFGTLDETPLDGFIAAYKSDIGTLAAVTQVPSSSLTGDVVNLSAEALASLRASLTQKASERQRSFGKSHDQMLRLAAHLEGDEASATDVAAGVTWQDMEIRSMAQAVDALGKAAQMLGVPPQALWGRIPGVTKSDVDEWKSLAEQGDSLGLLAAELTRQAASADTGL